MLKPDGTLVAITPRSFCNGLYFREFRQWFFKRMALDHIHLFESRTETFREVLQESLITSWHRLGEPSEAVNITASYGLDVAKSAPRRLPSSVVVDDSLGHAVIKVPATEEDSCITEIVETWPDRFSELGLRVSTGPVVMFRATEFLVNEHNRFGTVPLISVLNVSRFRTEWPVAQRKHPSAFRVCSDSMKLLLPVQNYVLVRRFSAKEERRRLTASCLLASDVPHPYVALENHLNYVYHAERGLTVDEAYGLAALFNSAFLDRYFRTLSGNTQVNATELRAMNFPALKNLQRIGHRVKALQAFDHDSVERVVLDELEINGSIRKHLLQSHLLAETKL